MDSFSTSLPFAALSASQAASMIREIVSEEIGKLNLQPHREQVANPDVLDMSGVLQFLSSIGVRIPKSSVYKATASGELTHEKLGRKLLFTEDAVLRWVVGKISIPETKADAALRLAEVARKRGSKSIKTTHTTENNQIM